MMMVLTGVCSFFSGSEIVTTDIRHCIDIVRVFWTMAYNNIIIGLYACTHKHTTTSCTIPPATCLVKYIFHPYLQ